MRHNRAGAGVAVKKTEKANMNSLKVRNDPHLAGKIGFLAERTDKMYWKASSYPWKKTPQSWKKAKKLRKN